MQDVTIEQIARMYGTTVKRVKSQYLANADGLKRMLDKSIKTGKKVNGYTSEQLKVLVDKYYKLAGL